MTALVFVDTNVLVYNRALDDAERQPKAAAWLEHLWRSQAGRLSVQVLQEYYVTVTQKLAPPTDRMTAREEIRNLAAWQPVMIDASILEQAWTLQDRLRISFWDATVVAAAQASKCSYLLTEDLQAGQDLGGVKVVDPFVTEPAALD